MTASRFVLASFVSAAAALAQQGDAALRADVDKMFAACTADTPGAVVLVARRERVVMAMLAAMAAPGTLDDGKAIDYGMGLMFSEIGGKRAIRHGGAWAAYRAELIRVPEAGLVVVCLCNRPDLEPSRLCQRIATAALRE
jgi:hypothetical protein